MFSRVTKQTNSHRHQAGTGRHVTDPPSYMTCHAMPTTHSPDPIRGTITFLRSKASATPSTTSTTRPIIIIYDHSSPTPNNHHQAMKRQDYISELGFICYHYSLICCCRHATPPVPHPPKIRHTTLIRARHLLLPRMPLLLKGGDDIVPLYCCLSNPCTSTLHRPAQPKKKTTTLYAMLLLVIR
jgi:hypothetical protein